MQQLKTFQQAVLFFANPQNCIDHMVKVRWPDGVVLCPTCGSKDVTWMPTRSLYQCKAKHPKRQFSVKVGTVLEDSPIPLGKWLVVTWMLVNCRNGVSSHEIGRTVGVTQKSAWFMLHRLREAMQDDSLTLSGEVEADEAYIGGRPKNRHRSKRKGVGGRSPQDKTAVFGMVERGGRAVAIVTHDAKESSILPVLGAKVEAGSTLYTDSFTTYDKVHRMPQKYRHHRINHQQDFYARGHVSTNRIENFWSCLKRALSGTYISVRPEHLMSYVAEQVFRFNHRRHFSEQERFSRVIEGIPGKRLTYKALIGRAA